MSSGAAHESVSAFALNFARFANRRLVAAAVLLLLGAVVESIGLLMLLPLFSVVLGQNVDNAWIAWLIQSMLAWVPQAGRVGQIALVTGIFALLMVARAAIVLGRDVLLTDLQVKFVDSHRIAIIRMLATSPWDVLSRLRHGRIAHVLGEDVQACGIAAHLMLQNTVAGAMLAAHAVLIAFLSPTLGLVLFAIAALSVASLRGIHRKAHAAGRTLTETQLKLMNATSQFLGGLKLAVSQDLQSRFVSEFESELKRAAAIRVRFSRERTLTQVAVTAWAAGGGAIAILVGAGLLDISPPTLLAVLFIVGRMSGPAAALQSGFHQLFHSLPAYGKIRELEQELGDKDVNTPRAATATPGPAPSGAIEFRNVTFRHCAGGDGGNGGGGVCDLSLSILPGEFVGLNGPSGAGKTTFLDLTVGLYRPQGGSIAIGGEPLEGARLTAWRQATSYVSQDSFLFHDTVRNNLLWAAPSASQDEIWQVLAETGADQIVRRMEGGLDTVVGERGNLVSGGERQRIAISRALLRRPALLLLDEATSALDPESERAVIARITGRSERPTIILVAHRGESLRLCDRVIALPPGPG